MHILITHAGISHAPVAAGKVRMIDCRCLQRRKQSRKDGSHEIRSVKEVDEKMSDLTPSRLDLGIHAVELQRM
jgi:hypothetical protein